MSDLDLTFHKGGEEEPPAWYCPRCSELVVHAVDGGGLYWVSKAAKEHQCPADLAAKQLPVARIRLREVLDELGISIQIYEDSYYSGSAELMLVDNKTDVQLRVGLERLG